MKSTTINNPTYAKQLILFDNIGSCGATPTDMDMVIEYKNIGYIFVELKYKNTPMTTGQRVALERMVKDSYIRTPRGLIKKPCIAVVAEHNIFYEGVPIIARDCVVRSIFPSDTLKWSLDHKGDNLGEFLDSIFDYYNELRTIPVTEIERRPITGWLKTKKAATA